MTDRSIHEPAILRRRSFLKLIGLAGVAATGGISAGFIGQLGVTVGGKMYRSDGSGRIRVSGNGGDSWNLHTNLGDGYSVARLSLDRGQNVRAQVRTGGRSFELVLDGDGRLWRTA